VSKLIGIVEKYREEKDVTLLKQPVAKSCSSTNDPYSIDEQVNLNDVARNAIINDDIFTPSNTKIEVDALGNVIVETRYINRGGIADTIHQKRVLHIPQEKAYQRIVEAVQKNFELLERLYEEGHRGALDWFRCSLFTAVLEAIIITLSICIPFLLHSLHLEKQTIPIIIFVILTNIINACIAIWIFRQTQLANKQVDNYLNSLTEIRKFSALTYIITHIQMSDTQKSLLQKALISSSLGIAALSEGTKRQLTGPLR
jgi:hypothetical protein